MLEKILGELQMDAFTWVSVPFKGYQNTSGVALLINHFCGYHNKENSGLKDITLVMHVVHQQGALIAIFRAKCVLLYYIFMNSLSCHFTYFCSNMSFQEQK